ncbi:MAG: hypothetical protein AMXMBFR34_34500 [Myxococcaceae bacterium]
MSVAPSFLTELQVQVGDEQVRFWAKVSRWVPCGATHQVEAAPFALSGHAFELWRRITSAMHPRGGAGGQQRFQVAAH